MSDWQEMEARVDGTTHRVRYRPRQKARLEGSAQSFEIQFWHDYREEWADVKYYTSRDWFSLGYLAGQKVDAQQELGI